MRFNEVKPKYRACKTCIAGASNRKARAGAPQAKDGVLSVIVGAPLGDKALSNGCFIMIRGSF